MIEIKELENEYTQLFGKTNKFHFSFCPYRLCPLGAHSDHQHGIISGFAINYGIYIAYTINDNALCKCISFNYEGAKSFNVDDTLEKQGDWADYIRGVIVSLQHRGYGLKYGINAYIRGEIPTGGLSSSAAVIIAFLKAISFVNDIELDNQSLIDIAFEAEFEFVGMNIGKMDQSCEVLSKKDRLLVLDTSNNEYETIEIGENHKPFKLLVVHSGAERLLADTSYNLRVDEMRSAAFVTLAYEGKNVAKFKDTYFRDVPYEMFEKHKDKLPTSLRKRAQHFYTEFNRVNKGKKLWQQGDIEGFGKLVTESGRSSIENYEAGSPILIDLYKIITSINGVYGGRFLGGGFNGALLAIINPQYENEIMNEIKQRYIKLYPEYETKMRMYLCTLEDGVGK